MPRPLALAMLTLAVVVAACAEPPLPETDPGEGAEAPLGARPLDPNRDELLAQIDRFRTSVEAVRHHVEAAVTAAEDGDVAAARQAADDATDQLLAPASGATSDPAPLLPSASSERGTFDDQGDVLSATLVAAREAGGALGRTTLDLLRDPIAGDVGAWERDAAGVSQQIRDAVPATATTDELEVAIAQLDGDAPRTLAWCLVAASATSPEEAADAGARALDHLEVVELALAVLAEVADGGATDGTDGGTDGTDGDADGGTDDGTDDGTTDADALAGRPTTRTPAAPVTP